MKYVKLFEEFTPNTVTCENCAWQWKMQDGGKDVFVCHECGHDNSPKFMNESEEKAKGDRGPIDNDAIETGLKKIGFSDSETQGILGNNWYNFYKSI